MDSNQKKFKKNTNVHLLLGITLVLLGIAVLADIVDVVPWRMSEIIFSWQMILIVLGVVFISGQESKSTGYILLAIGTFFIIPKFFDVPYFWRSLFWPSLLILVGILIIFSRGKRSHHNRNVSGSDENLLDDVAIFGGSDQILHSQNFQGGKITNIFGGAKYDMRKVVLAEGKNFLEVTMIFGGSKFILPEGWDVKMEVTSVFGGFSDKRERSIVVPDSTRQLIIRGIVIFGGGELTNI